jgi:hypothetical protein
MNADDQRKHKATTDSIRHDLTELIGAMDKELDIQTERHTALVKAVEELRAGHAVRLGTLDSMVNKLDTDLEHAADELRDDDDDLETDLNAANECIVALQMVRTRGFWGRMNWLITGR